MRWRRGRIPPNVSCHSEPTGEESQGYRVEGRASLSGRPRFLAALGIGMTGLPLREQLLEQGNRSRIIRLAEPEHRLSSHFGIAMRLRDADQDRDALVLGALREREHDLLLHLAIHARVLR